MVSVVPPLITLKLNPPLFPGHQGTHLRPRHGHAEMVGREPRVRLRAREVLAGARGDAARRGPGCRWSRWRELGGSVGLAEWYVNGGGELSVVLQNGDGNGFSVGGGAEAEAEEVGA